MLSFDKIKLMKFGFLDMSVFVCMGGEWRFLN